MAAMPGSGRLLTGRQDDAAGGRTQAVRTHEAQRARIRRDLLAWYAASRRDLPWRRTRDPWAIWVSEIMLQQTRVATVVPYFERFMARFPTPLALAEATEDQVLAAWSGLGYYRRARMLHAGARKVALSAEMPTDRDGLLELPGVGRYTAGAIASIAYGQPVGLVDGNVARVLARVFAIDEDIARGGRRIAEELADELVPSDEPGAFNQALMELGATVCTPRAPACGACPIAPTCRARAEGRVETLPVVAQKKAPKTERLQALVATLSGRVLLARRRSTGRFGGLWEPPIAEGGARAKRDLYARVPVRRPLQKGSVTHVLSHRRLTVAVSVGELAADASRLDLPGTYERGALFDEEALERLGVSALTRKILALARS